MSIDMQLEENVLKQHLRHKSILFIYMLENLLREEEKSSNFFYKICKSQPEYED